MTFAAFKAMEKSEVKKEKKKKKTVMGKSEVKKKKNLIGSLHQAHHHTSFNQELRNEHPTYLNWYERCKT